MLGAKCRGARSRRLRCILYGYDVSCHIYNFVERMNNFRSVSGTKLTIRSTVCWWHAALPQKFEHRPGGVPNEQKVISHNARETRFWGLHLLRCTQGRALV